MDRLTFFQAAHLNDQESIDQFVVRRRELDTIVSVIRLDDMSGSIQHYVIIGQRGSGKSTLLRRIEAEVQTDPSLTQRLVAVNLSEEQAGIYRLHDLWDRVAEELREQGIAVEALAWERFENDLTALARASYEMVQKGLKKARKKLVLLLDNIDRIFQNLSPSEAHLFRELLINHKDVRIIGGSTRLSEHHWKYDKPFYEFFQLIRLEPLGQEEMKDLMLFWSDRLNEPTIRNFVENHGGRLEALRILSDGTPRTMLHLLELVLQRPEDDGFDYLRRIVDKATPIYQERLGTLSPHQQKVLLELSFYWESATAGQLKKTARMDAKPISAALNKLTEMRYVETLQGRGKNKLYRVRERFFNLWLIMTQGGPKQKRRVKYLTIFLELWYGNTGLSQVVAGYKARLQRGELDAGHAALMTPALARSSCITAGDRDELIESTRPLLAGRKEYADCLPRMTSEACESALSKIQAGQFTDAIEDLEELEQDTMQKEHLLARAFVGLGEKDASKEHLDKALHLDSGPNSLTMAAMIHRMLQENDVAESFFLRAIDQGYGGAMFSLANLYRESGKTDQAESYYLRAIENSQLKALNNLANLYRDIGKTDKAESYYLRAIENGQLKALNNLGNLYRDIGKTDQAESYYLRAIENGQLKALNNLANLYRDTGKTDQAESYYLQAIENGELKAMNDLAALYRDIGKIDQAEAYYLQAIDKGNVTALNGLARLYVMNGKFDQAETYLLRGIEHGDAHALHNLVWIDYVNATNTERAKQLMRQREAMRMPLNLHERVTFALVLTWAGMPEQREDVSTLLAASLASAELNEAERLLSQLLVHGQVNQVWACFTDPASGELAKDKLQPLYFATAKLLGAKGADVMSTMPPELTATVESILELVSFGQEQFYPARASSGNRR